MSDPMADPQSLCGEIKYVSKGGGIDWLFCRFSDGSEKTLIWGSGPLTAEMDHPSIAGRFTSDNVVDVAFNEDDGVISFRVEA